MISTSLRPALLAFTLICLSGFTLPRAAATVIYYNDAPVTVPFFSAGAIDLDKDAQADFIVNLSGFQLYSTGLSGFQISTSGGYVALHGSDVTVDSSLSFEDVASINTGNWIATGGGLIAYRFQYEETLAYGWAQVVVGGSDAHITEWAFETSSAPILTGSTVSTVPEPSTYAALAGLGSLAIAAVYRRRRR